MYFTTEKFMLIKDKLKHNDRYSKYFYRMYNETSEFERVHYRHYRNDKSIKISKKKTLFNKWFKIKSCSDFWLWDVYHKNQVMDLKSINLCGYSECPNCRKVQLAKARLEFYPKIESVLSEGHHIMHLTLTVPNVLSKDLRDTLLKMNSSFKQFYKWLHENDRHGFKNRSINVLGAYRSLEITNKFVFDKQTMKGNTMFHLHFHCIIVLDKDYDSRIMYKYIEGDWSYKRQQVDLYSELDFEIMKLWTLAYNNKKIIDYNSFSDDYTYMLKNELYRCKIDYCKGFEGVMELLKYTYKDSQVNSYFIFKTLVNSLYGLRKRQGYGLLYGNFDFEGLNLQGEEKEDILQELLKVEESPKIILTRLNTLIQGYQSYRKISRYVLHKEVDKIRD